MRVSLRMLLRDEVRDEAVVIDAAVREASLDKLIGELARRGKWAVSQDDGAERFPVRVVEAGFYTEDGIEVGSAIIHGPRELAQLGEVEGVLEIRRGGR